MRLLPACPPAPIDGGSPLRRCVAGYAVLLCAVALIGGFVPAPPAQAAKPLEIAVEDDGLLLRGSDALRGQAWQRIRQLHASYVRVFVQWNDVVSNPTAKKRPKRIRYSLGQYDRLVREARASKVRVQMTLALSAPAWATGNHKVGKTNPSAKLFAAFARDMAKHYKGKVARYSILNESNLVVWLKPARTSAKQYRRIYALSYSAIKRADRKAKVFFGETAPFARYRRSGTQPLAWIKQVLKGARLKTDGFAHHPYSFRVPPKKGWPARGAVSIGSLNRLVKALKGYAKSGQLRTPGGRQPGIYLTEHGYMVHSPGAPAYRRTQALPQKKRASYWTQSLNIARRTPTVRQLLTYQLLPSPPTATWDTSILDERGNPAAPFNAIVNWIRRAPRGTVVQPR